MRHGKKINHLGRTASHRKAMLSNMASSLIIHKRISTTVAKAKALRVYVEPLITKAKDDTTHNRRVVFSYLQDKESVKELFDQVSEKVSGRPGGYTRIIKTGNRLGDNADMCIMELVDYNELLLGEKDAQKSKTRRSRRGAKKSADENQVKSAPPVEVKATAKVEEPVKEVESVEQATVEEEVAAAEVEPVENVVQPSSEESDENESAEKEDDSKKE